MARVCFGYFCIHFWMDTFVSAGGQAFRVPLRHETLSQFGGSHSEHAWIIKKWKRDEQILFGGFCGSVQWGWFRNCFIPTKNVDYQTRAAESVALLRIYSTTGSGSSSSSSNLGHSWLTITNLSGSTTNIAGLNVADGKSVTASTWDESVSLSSEHEVYGLIWIRRLIQWDRIFKMFPSKFL